MPTNVRWSPTPDKHKVSGHLVAEINGNTYSVGLNNRFDFLAISVLIEELKKEYLLEELYKAGIRKELKRF